MKYYLHNEAIKKGYKLTSYDIIGSTNDAACIIADNIYNQNIKHQTAFYKHWVISEKQEGGRGRRGRKWESPKGNLYASLLLYGDYSIKESLVMSYIAGLSLMDTINYFLKIYEIKNIDISLKWPNDIILNSKKLSGILLEVKQISTGIMAIVIGIGINIATKVDVAEYATICLNEVGIMCTVDQFFCMLSYYWLDNYKAFKNNGANIIKTKWLQYNSFKGKRIVLKTDKDIITGVFETIDDNFNCILRLNDDSLLSINTGDILLTSPVS